MTRPVLLAPLSLLMFTSLPAFAQGRLAAPAPSGETLEPDARVLERESLRVDIGPQYATPRGH